MELRTGTHGRQLLQDCDATTRIEQGGWRRLNTIAHYEVGNYCSVFYFLTTTVEPFSFPGSPKFFGGIGAAASQSLQHVFDVGKVQYILIEEQSDFVEGRPQPQSHQPFAGRITR